MSIHPSVSPGYLSSDAYWGWWWSWQVKQSSYKIKNNSWLHIFQAHLKILVNEIVNPEVLTSACYDCHWEDIIIVMFTVKLLSDLHWTTQMLCIFSGGGWSVNESVRVRRSADGEDFICLTSEYKVRRNPGVSMCEHATDAKMKKTKRKQISPGEKAVSHMWKTPMKMSREFAVISANDVIGVQTHVMYAAELMHHFLSICIKPWTVSLTNTNAGAYVCHSTKPSIST